MTPTPDATKLDELERLAKAATPGPYVRWSYEGDRDKKHRNSVCRHVGGFESDDHACVAHTVNRSEEQSQADAEYLAALDPATVLSLVAEVRRARLVDAALTHIDAQQRENPARYRSIATAYPSDPSRTCLTVADIFSMARELGWKEST